MIPGLFLTCKNETNIKKGARGLTSLYKTGAGFCSPTVLRTLASLHFWIVGWLDGRTDQYEVRISFSKRVKGESMRALIDLGAPGCRTCRLTRFACGAPTLIYVYKVEYT